MSDDFFSYNITKHIDKAQDTRTPDLGPCHLWTAARDIDGYGRFTWKRNGQPIKQKAHVYVILQQIDEEKLSHDKVVRHLCRNRHCCNPFHLLLGTQEQNILDSVLDGTHKRYRGQPIIDSWFERLRAVNLTLPSFQKKERGLKALYSTAKLHGVNIRYIRALLELQDLDGLPTFDEPEKLLGSPFVPVRSK